ncbi:MAG TPA: hypothetical protein VF438_04125 [Candidatus Paceibacterota bacterium]
MSIASYVANLREKPEHIRKRASFWWAFGITAIIAVIWLASFEFDQNPVRASAEAVAAQVSSPGESMVAAAGDLFGDLWSRIVGPKTVTFSEVQVLPGKN